MEKPNPDNKKYRYYHKKAGKKMFNNELFNKDCESYRKFIQLTKDKDDDKI